MIDLTNFVLTQVESRPDRNPTIKNDGIWICCPWHSGGGERTPSLRVRLTEGTFRIGDFYCFACQEKGDFNKLALKLDLKTIKKASLAYSHRSLPSENKKELPVLRNMLDWPENQEWRGIKGSILKQFGAKLEVVGTNLGLYLPIYIGKNYMGGVHARYSITQEEKRRGLLAYRDATGMEKGEVLFGYNQAKAKKGPVCIVEGPRDCLNIYQLGGRAVALLGSSISDKKAQFIQLLDAPFAIVLTDPDSAGDRAADQIKHKLTTLSVVNVRVRLPEGRDPADLNKKAYKRVVEIAEQKVYGG